MKYEFSFLQNIHCKFVSVVRMYRGVLSTWSSTQTKSHTFSEYQDEKMHTHIYLAAK